jgi:hydroxyisourate hydrolase
MRDWWQPGLERLNGLPSPAAEAELLACCHARRWARDVAAGRPYPDRGTLLAAADAASRRLGWDDVAEALAAHPRIGERAHGADREAAWSTREQSGAQGADSAVQTALAAGNRAYEQRFGHIFLIRAAGQSGAELLAALRERLGNDQTTERAVVADQLRQIAQLRLDQLLGQPAEAMQTVSPTSPVTTHVLDTVTGAPAEGVPVTLARHTSTGWQSIGHGFTDADGRIRDFGTPHLLKGVYRLDFATSAYLAPTGRNGFFPEIHVMFEIKDPGQRYHVPLLLSGHSYTTYRGS